MKFAELEPQFVRIAELDAAGDVRVKRIVETIGEAQGVMFLCPTCFRKNRGPVGTHRVVCWSRSRGVPDTVHPGPGRWRLDGTSAADLTLNGDPGSRSVHLQGGCGWHGFVTSGEVTDA